jgi:SAM-dependent methyltransferase
MMSGQDQYDLEFFRKQAAQSTAAAEVIVPLVLQYIKARSVVDVGCGVGAWLDVFSRHGAETVLGLDGDWVREEQLLIPRTRFRRTDLNGDWQIEGHFDLAVCLEVGEHLVESASGPLVTRLCKAAPAVLFSAALPGQGGRNHINEQWPEFWNGLFEHEGFCRLDPIRRQIWGKSDVPSWYQQNVYLFVSRQLVAESPVLNDELQRGKNDGLVLVHKRVLRPLKRGRSALANAVRVIVSRARERMFGRKGRRA